MTPTDLFSGDDLSKRARFVVARHLDNNRARIDIAMDEYEGTFPTLTAYVRHELDEHVAPYMEWILDYVALDRVANDWQASGRNWILPDRLPSGQDVVHVFLSSDPAALRSRES